jgi:hypothetical protein
VTIRTKPRRAVLVGVAGMTLILAACGGTSSAPTTTSTSSIPVTVPATTSSSTPAITAIACRNGQLAATPFPGGAAASNVSQVIQFVNDSSSTCTLTGYPGVAALVGAGAQVVQAKRELSGMLGGLQDNGRTPPTVTLEPGALASATVEGGDTPAGTETSCPSYHWFLVTPPDLTQSVKVAVGLPGSAISGFPGCSAIRVDPVVPGGSGRLN